MLLPKSWLCYHSVALVAHQVLLPVLFKGGGSGHEPFAIGYVGKGLLSASVLGDVFAAPSSASIYATIKNCSTDVGVLLIVTNYTGKFFC